MEEKLESNKGFDRRTVLKTAGAGIGATAFLSFSGVGAADHDGEVDLLASQDVPVGTVTAETDSDHNNLTVTYDTSGSDWELLETHLHVADEVDDIPTTRSGNPKVGHFEYSSEPDPAPDDTGVYTVDISGMSGTIYVAAHAVVQEVLEEAPYFAAQVEDSDQGTKKNLDPVDEERSNPVAALEQEYPDGVPDDRDDIGFFSLGFNHDDEEGEFEEEGGSIVVSFDCPLQNGEGDDLRVWEVTFGTAPDDYPVEKARIDAWYEEGNEWVSFPEEADNRDQGPAGSPDALTISDFDLDDVGLESTTQIRIVDTTDPSIHNAQADGFDLDGIQALQDCTSDDETAWGDGERFVDNGNWATYFTLEEED